MTTTAAKPLRSARIGMTIEQAATLIRSNWDRYQELKGNTLELDEHGGCTLYQLMSVYTLDQLREDIRDCGWCIGHSHGFDGLRKLHDQAVSGLDRNGDGCDLSRQIDIAFAGIAGWMV